MNPFGSIPATAYSGPQSFVNGIGAAETVDAVVTGKPGLEVGVGIGVEGLSVSVGVDAADDVGILSAEEDMAGGFFEDD